MKIEWVSWWYLGFLGNSIRCDSEIQLFRLNNSSFGATGHISFKSSAVELQLLVETVQSPLQEFISLWFSSKSNSCKIWCTSLNWIIHYCQINSNMINRPVKKFSRHMKLILFYFLSTKIFLTVLLAVFRFVFADDLGRGK